MSLPSPEARLPDPNTAPRHKFETLDGLRGLAAILVVWFHQHMAGISPFPDGVYLAVDLFFLMSGFVIAHAYEARLGQGLGVWAFMRVRLIRLYPLYILGSAFGMIVMLAFGRLSAFHGASVGEMLRAIASAIFMVPYVTPEVSVGLFPLNGPAWSLFFELVANLAYALIGPRLSSRMLGAICAAAGVLVVLAALRYGTLNLGHRTDGLWVGFPRVIFSFSAGVLLYRMHKAGRLPKLAIHPLWVIAAAAILLLLPAKGPSAGPLAAAIVILAFPLLLIAGVGALTPGPRVGKAFALSGEVSYPLYAVHGPLVVGLMMAGRFWAWPLGPVQPWIGIVIAPVLAIFALGVSRVYDQPVRAWVSAWRPRRGRRLAASEA